MKFQKLALLSSSLLLGASLFVGNAFASVAPTTTYVIGKVTTSGSPVDGASVSILCNGHPQSDTSNSSGDYEVNYTSDLCKNGDTATVTATKNGQSGTASSQVNNFTATIDLAIVNPVIPVPEFGLVAGAVAALTSVGTYLKLKKKN